MGLSYQKNCCVETALEMSGCSKMWDILTDLCLFSNRDCWISSSKTGVLLSLQKNALNFIRFSNKASRQRSIDVLQLRCFREAYIKLRFGISPILVHRLRYRNDIIPRDLLCPVCKDEIEGESHVLFSCKAYEDFRKDVSWFNGSHTAAVADVSHVMSADNETRRVFGKCPIFCTKFCKGETTL